MKTILAWHFTDGPKLRDGQLLERKTYHVEPPLELCKHGLHASRKIVDALRLGPGLTVSRVRCSGEIVEGEDKLVCSDRTVLWSVDAKDMILLWCAACAERAVKREKNPDPRSVAAIEAVRDFVAGKITKDQMIDAANAANAANNAAHAAYAANAAYAAANAAANAAAYAAAAAAYAAANAAAYAANAAAYADASNNPTLDLVRIVDYVMSRTDTWEVDFENPS